MKYLPLDQAYEAAREAYVAKDWAAWRRLNDQIYNARHREMTVDHMEEIFRSTGMWSGQRHLPNGTLAWKDSGCPHCGRLWVASNTYEKEPTYPEQP